MWVGGQHDSQRDDALESKWRRKVQLAGGRPRHPLQRGRAAPRCLRRRARGPGGRPSARRTRTSFLWGGFIRMYRLTSVGEQHTPFRRAFALSSRSRNSYPPRIIIIIINIIIILVIIIVINISSSSSSSSGSIICMYIYIYISYYVILCYTIYYTLEL